MRLLTINRSLMLSVILCSIASMLLAQPAVPKPPREIFRDADGNQISNNEFVDIRMANFHLRDATVIATLDDGTKEFRLQKIPQEGMAAPDFTVITIDGETLRSTELKGKVVVLTFWFIGCPACRNIEPKLNAFKARFAGERDVVFVAMTPDAAAEVKKYIGKEPFDFIHVADAKPAMNSFVFTGFPKNIVIGRDGKIVYWRSTIHAWDKFESVVRTELAKN